MPFIFRRMAPHNQKMQPLQLESANTQIVTTARHIVILFSLALQLFFLLLKKSGIMKQRVINFSGGLTSAYMTIKNYRPGDIVLYTDTGREHPKTYKFLNDFEAFESIPVHKTSYKDSMDAMAYMINSRKHKFLPNITHRTCTVTLKIRTAKAYLKKLNILSYESFIGFRFDEPDRVLRHIERFKKVKTSFPLYYNHITKQHILDFWSYKPYTLEIPSILGNCTLCFMKGKNAIINILQHDPTLAAPWIADEKKAPGQTFIKGISMETMLQISQSNLFPGQPLEQTSKAFNCACSS